MSLGTMARRWVLAAALLGGAAMGMTAAPTAVHAQSPGVSMVSSSLLRFEGAVTWTSVSPRWRTQRAAWVAAVSNAHTPQELAQQIVALETAMGWSAVQPSWRQERAAWVARARAVTTARDAAQLLLGLENTTKWESVAPAWRTDRGAWVSALQSVTGS